MALSESDIERVCNEVLALENAYLTELSALLLSHLKQGIWDASDEVILLELKDELSTRVNTLQAKHEPVIEHKLSSEVIAALIGAALVDLSNLKKHYDEPIQPVETTKKRLKTTAEQLTTGLVTTLRRQNLAMAANAQKAWYEASTEAVSGIQKGGLSYDEALSNAVRTLGESFTVRYSSGRTTSPDVALRRLMVTEMSQAGGRMSLEAMESYGHELAITSTHYGARPSHAMWQGKPFGIHGAVVVDGVKYPGMVELTDYGSVTGLKGINCRHMIEPYFPNITELPDREFKEEKAKWGKSSDEYYEATQRQRALERRVRATKTTVAQMEKVGLGLEDPAYVQRRLVLGRQQRELKAWVNANKLPRQPLREKAYGVAKQPRSLSGKSWTGSATVDALKSTRYGKVKAVNVKGVSPTLFNNQVKAINEIASKIPILDESLKKYGLVITSSKINGVAYTNMRDGKWRVVFNTETFSSKASFKAGVWENIKHGYFMPATKSGSSSYPAVHELGHILQKSIVEKELGANYTYWQYQKMADKHREEIMNIVNLKDDKLSKYAKRNSRDFFAECFANLNCGKPNAYGIALSEFLKQRGLL